MSIAKEAVYEHYVSLPGASVNYFTGSAVEYDMLTLLWINYLYLWSVFCLKASPIFASPSFPVNHTPSWDRESHSYGFSQGISYQYVFLLVVAGNLPYDPFTSDNILQASKFMTDVELASLPHHSPHFVKQQIALLP